MPPTAVRLLLPPGTAGIRKTLQVMQQLTQQGLRDPVIREHTMRVVQNVRHKDWDGELMGVHAWVRDHIRYVKDPVDTLEGGRVNGIEYLSTPRAVLRTASGDCDDQAVLLASMLGAIGHPSRFVAVAMNGKNFSHVFVESPTKRKTWLAAETTEPVKLGWTPTNVTKRLVVSAVSGA